MPDDALLYVSTHTARILERDLDKAGIPKDAAAGKLDFHRFRVTYATLVDGSGATAKEARELCRHSNPELRFDRYVKANDERLLEVADKVADKVLAENLGANMLHPTDGGRTNENGKSLENKGLTINLVDWRRGDSNPRPLSVPVGFNALKTRFFSSSTFARMLYAFFGADSRLLNTPSITSASLWSRVFA